MKTSESNVVLATVALLVAGIIGGFPALAAKVVLREFPPFTLLFLRITLMVLILIPLRVRSLPRIFKNYNQIGRVGLYLAGNMALFIFGLSKTTVFVSSVLYAGVPLIIFLEHVLFSKKRIDAFQAIGVLLGFIGIVLVLTQSTGAIGFGSLEGNIYILLATVSWSMYLLYSKHISQQISAMDLTVGAAIVVWFVAFGLMLTTEGIVPLLAVATISPLALYALVFLGVGAGVGMTFLYQWGTKYGSPLVAGSMIYISTLLGAAMGMIFLGEQINMILAIGALSILIGVFFISVYPLLVRTPKKIL